MSIGPIHGVTAAPAFLPVRRHGSAPEFALALRAQIRAEIAQTIGDELSGSSATSRASTVASQSALQQSLLAGGGSTGGWLQVSKSIGGQYLSPQVAEVFSRQMQLESAGFDPDVIAGRRVSSAGAEGIAQLMPSSYPHVNRRDPVASLHAAAATMRQNLQTYGGDLKKALAAYNAGAGTVNAAVSRFGATWEQGLPEETRLYLRTLLGGTNG